MAIGDGVDREEQVGRTLATTPTRLEMRGASSRSKELTSHRYWWEEGAEVVLWGKETKG
jgi:hypothetical protein